jgi:hypothetical protein
LYSGIDLDVWGLRAFWRRFSFCRSICQAKDGSLSDLLSFSFLVDSFVSSGNSSSNNERLFVFFVWEPGRLNMLSDCGVEYVGSVSSGISVSDCCVTTSGCSKAIQDLERACAPDCEDAILISDGGVVHVADCVLPPGS